MSAAFSSPSGADTESARWAAATIRGIGLLRVLKEFAKSVFGLGLAMSDVVARAKHVGADPYAADAGRDLGLAMYLMRRALLLVDALRTRLRTPEVIAALKKPRAPRNPGTGEGTGAALNDTLSQLLFLRRDAAFRSGWRRAIAELSDRQVLAHIYHDLRQASVMLGDTAVAAKIEKLAYAASAWLEDDDKVAPEAAATAAATRPAEPAMADDGPAPAGAADPPPPHAHERGPP